MSGTECRPYLRRSRLLFSTAAIPALGARPGVGFEFECMCFHHSATFRIESRSALTAHCARFTICCVAVQARLAMSSPVSGTTDTVISELLAQSQVLHDYESAFSGATGLPLKFAPVGKKRAGMRGSPVANEFCVHMAETEPGCRLCVEMQAGLSAAAAKGQTHTANCPAGLTDSAVPVRLGDRVMGYLQTGQVALKKLTPAGFRRVADFLKKGGADTDWATLEKAYLNTRVISRKQYDAVLRLLEVFAGHLSIAAEQIATRQSHTEPPLVTRAREFIEHRSGEDITLGEIARYVHASTFHFCKTFKRATGMTFTQYLSMIRIAKAKRLLANPQARISEVAFDSGFASITHFNRMFRRVTGQSPTDFRRKTARV